MRNPKPLWLWPKWCGKVPNLHTAKGQAEAPAANQPLERDRFIPYT
jgi:hypothetical protein